MDVGFVGQAGVVGNLAQACEALKQQKLRAGRAVLIQVPQDFIAVETLGFLVGVGLFLRHLTVAELLRFCWQLLSYLGFVPPQNKRLDEGVQPSGAALVLMLFNGLEEFLTKKGLRAQQAGIDEGHLRPEVHGAVFHRRTREDEAVLGAQLAHRLRSGARRVFDGLRLVQNHVVEAVAHQQLRVEAHDAVAGQHHVVVAETVGVFVAVRAGVGQHPQFGRELAGLIHPVEYQRSRQHQ